MPERKPHVFVPILGDQRHDGVVGGSKGGDDGMKSFTLRTPGGQSTEEQRHEAGCTAMCVPRLATEAKLLHRFVSHNKVSSRCVQVHTGAIEFLLEASRAHPLQLASGICPNPRVCQMLPVEVQQNLLDGLEEGHRQMLERLTRTRAKTKQ